MPRRADFCIAVTDELGARLRRVGVRDDAVACIEPVAAPAELRPVADAGAEPLVCYAGNLDGYQNLDVPPASLPARPCGRAGGTARARDPRRRAGERSRLVAGSPVPGVEIVQAASYDEVRTRLARAAVAVCPRSEGSGFPMKLLNYMAAGKAIVASAGSAKGLVDGVTARIVPDGDAAAFAAAVVALLRDAEPAAASARPRGAQRRGPGLVGERARSHRGHLSSRRRRPGSADRCAAPARGVQP